MMVLMKIDSGIFPHADDESERDEIKLERSVNMVHLKRWKNVTSTKSGAAGSTKSESD